VTFLLTRWDAVRSAGSSGRLPLRTESKKATLAVTPTQKLFILADSPADTRQNMKLTFKCGINKFLLRRSGWGPL
jgi:hypothetical protein